MIYVRTIKLFLFSYLLLLLYPSFSEEKEEKGIKHGENVETSRPVQGNLTEVFWCLDCTGTCLL